MCLFSYSAGESSKERGSGKCEDCSVVADYVQTKLFILRDKRQRWSRCYCILQYLPRICIFLLLPSTMLRMNKQTNRQTPGKKTNNISRVWWVVHSCSPSTLEVKKGRL